MRSTALVFATLFAAALAIPVDDSKDAQILKYESENIGIGGYNFAFETSDGTSRQEQAKLKNIGTQQEPQESLSVRGSFSWIGGDGQTYILNYVADENGFQPEGAHLPHV